MMIFRILFDQLYYKFRTWITNHPNLGLYQGKSFACPNCGSINLMKNGLRFSKTNAYQRWRCKDCLANCQSVKCTDEHKAKIKN